MSREMVKVLGRARAARHQGAQVESSRHTDDAVTFDELRLCRDLLAVPVALEALHDDALDVHHATLRTHNTGQVAYSINWIYSSIQFSFLF